MSRERLDFLLIFCWFSVIITANTMDPSLSSTSNNNHHKDNNINYNQVIKLIIKSYVNQMLDNPMTQPDELKNKLIRISEHIAAHPALHQQYLWVGPRPPPNNYNPDYHIIEYEHGLDLADDNGTTTNWNQLEPLSSLRAKRPIMKIRNKKNSDKREQLPSEEICETKEKWEQIVDTHDLFDKKVKVIQEKDMQQFVFTYRCAQNKGKCLGISPLFESECTERFGWMYMYYKQDDKPAQWGFVNAPHHCACKLKPKLFKKDESISPNEI